jgi:hypothetical protein
MASKAPSSLLLSYSPVTGMANISKNVAAVTEVATGRFCVTPAKKIPAGSIPVVTVEYGTSIGANLLAYYELSAHDCSGATDIEVRTFDFTGGTATPADNIAFNVNVQ